MKNEKRRASTKRSSGKMINNVEVPLYPTIEYMPVPILNNENNEIISIYIPMDESHNFFHTVPAKGVDILEANSAMDQLLEYFRGYLERSYLITIEDRLNISYQQMVSLFNKT
jgi:hypothetical protein